MSTTWIICKGGPGDGLHIPTGAHCCTERLVIYRVGGEYGQPSTKELKRPAIYRRDDADQGTHKNVGMDGIERESPSIGYVFEACVTPERADEIERIRDAEFDAGLADGASY